MPWSRTADRQRRDCPTLLTVKQQSLHSASKPLWIVPDRKQFRARSIKIALATGPGFLYDGFGRESCAPELTHGGDIRSASPHTGAQVLRNLLIFSSSRFRFFSALSMASMIAYTSSQYLSTNAQRICCLRPQVTQTLKAHPELVDGGDVLVSQCCSRARFADKSFAGIGASLSDVDFYDL